MPDWLQRRYELLWSEFGSNAFGFEDAARVLMDRNRDAWEQVPNFLSELRKAGWVFVESDVRDARLKVYRLKSREEAVKEAFVFEKRLLRCLHFFRSAQKGALTVPKFSFYPVPYPAPQTPVFPGIGLKANLSTKTIY